MNTRVLPQQTQLRNSKLCSTCSSLARPSATRGLHLPVIQGVPGTFVQDPSRNLESDLAAPCPVDETGNTTIEYDPQAHGSKRERYCTDTLDLQPGISSTVAAIIDVFAPAMPGGTRSPCRRGLVGQRHGLLDCPRLYPETDLIAGTA